MKKFINFAVIAILGIAAVEVSAYADVTATQPSAEPSKVGNIRPFHRPNNDYKSSALKTANNTATNNSAAVYNGSTTGPGVMGTKGTAGNGAAVGVVDRNSNKGR